MASVASSDCSRPRGALRYCLLHVAGIVATTGRQHKLRLADDWPWTDALIAAFDRIHHRPMLV